MPQLSIKTTLSTVTSIILVCILSLTSPLSLAWGNKHKHRAAADRALQLPHIPVAQPTKLAQRFSAYISGSWQVIGSDTRGKKLAQARLQVRQIAAGHFLSLRYRSVQFSDMDQTNISSRNRSAFMIMYFEPNNKFHLLSFQPTGAIRYYKGDMHYRHGSYHLKSQPINMGPARGQAVFDIKPMGKNRYLESFYFNIFTPGSYKVLRQKVVMRIIASRVHKHKKPHEHMQPGQHHLGQHHP